MKTHVALWAMKKIGLISDTHRHVDPRVFHHFEHVDEIWHAGDIGCLETADQLADFKPLRAVYGNIDGQDVRVVHPEVQDFYCEGVHVVMIHIGGYPGRYSPKARTLLDETKPNLFISGHSHILKVMYDQKRSLLHMNPGAAGISGFHKVKTLIRFVVDGDKIDQLEVIELGPKSAKKS